MKKSVRLFITGTVQSMFFEQFIKQNAERLNVRGFIRILPNTKIEIFLEGSANNVNEMIEICKKGDKHAQIRDVQEQIERFQNFNDFKVLKF